MCGGTDLKAAIDCARVGLSPRVRGNHGVKYIRGGRVGSIPACAGEPRGWMTWLRMRGVYPRVCGGTARRNLPYRIDPGLSPRVRGNLRDRKLRTLTPGSIPACAGEP